MTREFNVIIEKDEEGSTLLMSPSCVDVTPRQNHLTN